MKIKINVDPELQDFTAKIPRKTYNEIPKNRKPELIDNNCFWMGDMISPVFLVYVTDSLETNYQVIFVHPSVKKAYYQDIEYIEV